MTETTTPATEKGIKETREAIIAALEITTFLIKRLKDGVGIDDAVAIFDKLKDDDEFKSKIAAAYDNVKEVPAELKDINIREGLDIANLLLSYIPSIVDVFES